MTYRCVKSYDSFDVLAIGRDEGQGGVDYHGQGAWCSFTFLEIPQIPADVQEKARQVGYDGPLHKVVDNSIMAKAVSDIPG